MITQRGTTWINAMCKNSVYKEYLFVRGIMFLMLKYLMKMQFFFRNKNIGVADP